MSKKILLMIILLFSVCTSYSTVTWAYNQSVKSIGTSDKSKEYDMNMFVKEIEVSYDEELLTKSDVQDIIDTPASELDYIYDKNKRKVYLLNDRYYDVLLGSKQYSIEELNRIIDDNTRIPIKYKNFMKDYTRIMLEFYPDVETRVYAENLSHLEVVENTDALFLDEYSAYFNKMKKKIYIRGALDIENNVMDRLILRHELGHLFTNLFASKHGLIFVHEFGYHQHGKNMGEALNVVFTCKPFNDEYKKYHILDQGYNLITNNVEIILLAMDDYDFQEFVKGNVYEIESIMNDYSKKNHFSDGFAFNYIEDIMELQWLEYDGSDVHIDDVYYDDLYSYLAEIYAYSNDEVNQENIDFYMGILRQRLLNNIYKKPDYFEESFNYAREFIQKNFYK